MNKHILSYALLASLFISTESKALDRRTAQSVRDDAMLLLADAKETARSTCTERFFPDQTRIDLCTTIETIPIEARIRRLLDRVNRLENK